MVAKSTRVVCCCRCPGGLCSETPYLIFSQLHKKIEMRATLISKADEKQYNIPLKGVRIGSEGCEINIQVTYYLLSLKLFA